MRGRGLLVAAAVMQLVGAALFAFTTAFMALFAPMTTYDVAQRPSVASAIRIAVLATLAIPAAFAVASIALLRGRRWGWIMSLALDGFAALSFLALPLVGHVGFGELLILLPLIGLPLFVTIGLLIGGRHAVFASKTAAEPMVVTPPRDG